MSLRWLEVVPHTHPSDDIDLGKLSVDQAYLNLTTDQELSVYSVSDDCNRCPFTYQKLLNGSELMKVSTKFGMTWRFYDGRFEQEIDFHDTESMLCEIRPKNFGEFGLYSALYEEGNCTVETQIQPVNIYTPLLLVGLGILVVSLFFSLIACIKSRCTEKSERQRNGSKRRVAALDTFRGISIVLMIFVNNGGGHYWFFDHATWNGLLIADLVFPWFMWIMGVCIPIAIGSQMKKGSSRAIVFANVLRRSVLLFLLGLALNTVGKGPDLSTLRIMGVLQRFSICYLVVAILVTFLTFNFNISDNNQASKPGIFSDLIHLLPHWIVVLLIFAGHCYLTFFFPVPRCPKGYLGPGGIDQDGAFRNCTGGATGYLDRMILGPTHIYQYPTASTIYLTGPYDPEGLIGCLTSIVQVFLGVQAGVILMYYQKVTRAVVTRWLIWASILGLLGLILCQARQDGGWIPVNKNLWSFSYVCVTSCFAFLLLTLLYYLIDIKKYWSGAPFLYPGMNATILYVGHQVCYQMFPWHWRLGPMNTHFILTLENLWGTALWVVIAYWLYKQKFFLAL